MSARPGMLGDKICITWRVLTNDPTYLTEGVSDGRWLWAYDRQKLVGIAVVFSKHRKHGANILDELARGQEDAPSDEADRNPEDPQAEAKPQ